MILPEYLGADANKGQRSSSLHYAACFGRAQVAKILLKYGANPDLRDEDGKTPLDKARERNDEGHLEVFGLNHWNFYFQISLQVAAVLESSGEYLRVDESVSFLHATGDNALIGMFLLNIRCIV